jgi:hypothetical protein
MRVLLVALALANCEALGAFAVTMPEAAEKKYESLRKTRKQEFVLDFLPAFLGS